MAKACQVVCRREARHTEANMAALNDRAPGTLKMGSKLQVNINRMIMFETNVSWFVTSQNVV